MSLNEPDVDSMGDEPAEATGPDPVGREVQEVRRLLDAARHHLAVAGGTAGVGTDIPDDARLRSVKQAAVLAMRPVTSHQAPFNTEVLLVADRLTTAIETLTFDVMSVDLDHRLQRVRAAVATLEVQVDDLDHARRSARDDVEAVLAAFADVSAEVDGLARVVATLRARDEAVPRPADVGAHAVTPGSDRERTIARRLATATGPAPETVASWGAALADTLAGVPGPVLDLASGRGEWLGVWSGLDLEARGVDDDEPSVERLRDRGHDVVLDDPIGHLGTRPPGSLGAVTAASLADVTDLADVVRVADAAREALRPGGLIVLAAAHPLDAAADDELWIDPRRRPVRPELLVALAVDRGYAEVSTVALERTDDGGSRAYALVARTAGEPDRHR